MQNLGFGWSQSPRHQTAHQCHHSYSRANVTLHPTCVTAKPGSGEKNDMALKIVKLKLAQAMNDKVALNITSLC